MTEHNHTEFVPGCFRCDLSREEVSAEPTVPAPSDLTGLLAEHAHSANGPRADNDWYVICGCRWRDQWHSRWNDGAATEVECERERDEAMRRHRAHVAAVIARDWLPEQLRAARAEALREAADAIQALHPGEVKNSVRWLRVRANGVHTRTSTNGHGPDYCRECSEAINDWVQWPCDRADRETP